MNLTLSAAGKPQAAIVLGKNPTPFTRWVGGELQRYIKQLAGAELPIATSDHLPAAQSLLVLGSPKENPLAAQAQERKLVNFTGLKPEGFILKTTELDQRPAVIVGGNDDAGTMYAAYELLERLGVVFQLTGDIIPERKPDLAVPPGALDVRTEPVLTHRGMHCCHGLRWYMGLEDFRKHIDQMAKLKLNRLQFYFGIAGSPWLKFSYKGTVAEMFYPQESGYLAWGGPGAISTSGTADDVRVGRECFPSKYLGPPEFANVKTPEEAFATAKDFLHEVIRYAHTRQVQVWPMVGEIPRVPPNLVPASDALPKGWAISGSFYCGHLLPHGHPAVLEVWDAAMHALIETYPDADGYGVWNSEDRPSYHDAETSQLTSEFAAMRHLVLPVEEIRKQGSCHVPDAEGLESDFAELCVTTKIINRIRGRHPGVKLGVATLFRGYLLQAIDAMLPKDVWVMNMENFMNDASVMHFYKGITGRELLAMPRVDDDGCELHMQLNASMYERDEIITGAARYGLAGFVGQLNKERGLEWNARFLADGAWNPKIDCRSFYEGFLPRVFGPAAKAPLVQAFLLMEEADKILGWHGHSGIFVGYNRFDPVMALRISALSDAPEKIATQDVQKEIDEAATRHKRFTDLGGRYRQALALLQQAKPSVLPGAKDELDYVIFKTANFAAYFDVLVAGYEAVIALDGALLARQAGRAADVKEKLAQARAALERSDRLAREVAREMIPFAGIPTEKYQLFRFNQNVIGWIEKSRAGLEKGMAPA